MKEINLEEIFYSNHDYYTKFNTFDGDEFEECTMSCDKFKETVEEICKQVLELAAENAKMSGYWGEEKFIDDKLCTRDNLDEFIDISINEDSILNTINQVK